MAETEWWFRICFSNGSGLPMDTTMFIRQSAFRFRSAWKSK